MMGCGILSWDLLYFPAIIILYAIKFVLFKEINPNSEMHGMTLNFLNLFAQTFGGLGTIYFYFKEQYQKQKTKNNKPLIKKRFYFKLIQSQALKSKWRVYLFAILLSFIHAIVSCVLSYILCIYSTIQINGKIYHSFFDYKMQNIQIIFISLLTYIILKRRLYRHQWISLVIILIGFAMILFPNIVNEIDIHIRVPLIIGTYFLASIKSVAEKYIMEVYYITSHQLTLCDGLFGSIFSFFFIYILQIILSNETSKLIGNIDDLCIEFKSIFVDYPLYCILAIISIGSSALILKLIRFEFTPMHCCIFESFSVLVLWLFFVFQYTMSNIDISMTTIGFVLLIIGNLIYNEIVILFFCGLQMNTKLEIVERSENDLKNATLTGIGNLVGGETINYNNNDDD